MARTSEYGEAGTKLGRGSDANYEGLRNLFGEEAADNYRRLTSVGSTVGKQLSDIGLTAESASGISTALSLASETRDVKRRLEHLGINFGDMHALQGTQMWAELSLEVKDDLVNMAQSTAVATMSNLHKRLQHDHSVLMPITPNKSNEKTQAGQEMRRNLTERKWVATSHLPPSWHDTFPPGHLLDLATLTPDEQSVLLSASAPAFTAYNGGAGRGGGTLPAVGPAMLNRPGIRSDMPDTEKATPTPAEEPANPDQAQPDVAL